MICAYLFETAEARDLQKGVLFFKKEGFLSNIKFYLTISCFIYDDDDDSLFANTELGYGWAPLK